MGISTKDASLQCQGYVGLLGSDDQSWGWNLVDNNLLHNGDAQGNYPLLNNCPKYQVGFGIKCNIILFEITYFLYVGAGMIFYLLFKFSH